MEKIDYLDGQMLGSFVDGQLDAANSELIIKAMEDDLTVRDQVYKLRRAKDLMKLGFGGARAPTRDLPRFKTSRWYPTSFRVCASVMVLVVGFFAGYLGYYGGKLLDNRTAHAVAPLAQQKTDRVLLHISQSDPKQYAAVFEYIEGFLKKHKEQGGQVAVVANAGGLDLLREGVSPFEKEIIALIQKYENVHFIACANSIRALRNKGVEPVIIRNIDSSMPAMDQIIKHVQEGWTYVKVKSLLEV